MYEFPLPLSAIFGHWGAYVVYLLVGIGFGYILESAGFGNSKKLAGQFYFKDLAVFKVMMTAIVTAMTLIFFATSLGLLDYNLIWVPPTYLWPGIVGGLLMGVGFIVGGFCPGTSLVAVTTKKIDGMFFVVGVLIGIFAFGETVANFDIFFNSHYYGRYTLPEWLGSSYGAVVLGIVIIASLLVIYIERFEQSRDPDYADKPTWGRGAMVATAVVALAVLLIGQPTNTDRWQALEDTLLPKLDNREVHISPQELLSLMNDTALIPILLDVREEKDYNQFHIQGSRLMPMESLVPETELLQMEPANAVVVVISNDEKKATEAWKILKAENLPNVYLLDGGINHWLRFFADPEFLEQNAITETEDGCLNYRFKAALGDRIAAAEPEYSKHDQRLKFEPKIKLQLKRAPTSGGCG